MAKKHRKKKKQQALRSKPIQGESRGVEAITVFWTTSVLATTGALIVALICRAVLVVAANEAFMFLSVLLLIIATATGAVGLALTPIVLRWRTVPPPTALVRFAIGVCLLPLLLLVLLAMS